jgi:ribosomal protein L2
MNAGYTDYARAKGKREGQMVQIAYDPSRPVSIAPVGGDGDPRIIEAVFLALGSAVSAGIAVYFAVRAFG